MTPSMSAFAEELLLIKEPGLVKEAGLITEDQVRARARQEGEYDRDANYRALMSQGLKNALVGGAGLGLGSGAGMLIGYGMRSKFPGAWNAIRGPGAALAGFGAGVASTAAYAHKRMLEEQALRRPRDEQPTERAG